jgi:hypothetical protein
MASTSKFYNNNNHYFGFNNGMNKFHQPVFNANANLNKGSGFGYNNFGMN